MYISVSKKYVVYGLYGSKEQEIRYIGVTYRPRRRLQDHLQHAKKLKTHRDKWIMSLLKSGQELEIVIIEECDSWSVGRSERFWIRYFRPFGAGLTNHSDGGEGQFHPDLTTVQKIKAALKGKKAPRLTEDGRQKISRVHRGAVFSKERRRKISEAKKGRPFTLEHRQKLSAAKLGKSRKPFTEETINRMRLAQQRRTR